jgi:hypothetical protein
LRWLRLAAALLVVGLAASASAQERPPEQRIWFEPAPEISVLTFGPGDAAFLKFGHNAIRVKYPENGPDIAYNFGTFRFDDPWLILDFLTGKFQYWLSAVSFNSAVEHYRRANRDVIEQVLNVSRPNAWTIAEKLRENALPENRYYVYDYYRDNCSTRIRDVLDDTLKGVLQERAQGRGSMTLREHTLRLVADDFWLYLGLDIAMGPNIDQPESRWGEMFLPSKLEEGLASFAFSGPHGTHQMVKERHVHARATGRSGVRSKPPDRTPAFFQAGAFGAALLIFLGWEAYHRRRDWARTLLAALIGVYGLVVGVLGLLFSSLWAFTNHEVTYYNENVLQCAPWGIILVGCAWGIHRNNPRRIQLAYRVAQGGLAAALAGFVGKFLPFMEQQNERIIALFLPLWIGVFVALRLTHLRALRMLTLPIEGPTAAEASEAEREPEDAKPSTRPPPPGPSDEEDEDEDDDAPAPSGQPAPA